MRRNKIEEKRAEIGALLKKIRETAGITYKDISLSSKFSKYQITDFEQGKTSYTVDTLIMLAELIELDLIELLENHYQALTNKNKK